MRIVPADGVLKPYIMSIGVGNDSDLERQLIAKSKQPNILKYTPKDSAERFSDHDAFRAWQAGGRELYWLIGPSGDLAGVVWYGKREFPIDMKLADKPDETFAIRLYEGYSGHGLAGAAMTQTLRMHVASAHERGDATPGLWLETDTDNAAALKAYARFGYEEVHRTPQRVTMLLTPHKIERIISG